MEPLNLFKSVEVKNLLLSFYKANFLKAGIDSSLADKIINTIWEQKNSTSFTTLRLEIKQYFEIAKTNTNNHPRERNLLNLLSLNETKTFLDFGANKMTTVNFVARQYPNIEKIFAIDIVPQHGPFKHPDKCIYFQITKNLEFFPFEDKSIDCINIQFVLHHLENVGIVNKLFQQCRRIISNKGKLIIWEESYTFQMPSLDSIKSNNALGTFTDLKLTQIFYSLSEKERLEFIIINDWIINVNNEHIQWWGQIKPWQEWTRLISKYNFNLKNQFNLGLRVGGKLKQGVHMVGEFIPV